MVEVEAVSFAGDNEINIRLIRNAVFSDEQQSTWRSILMVTI